MSALRSLTAQAALIAIVATAQHASAQTSVPIKQNSIDRGRYLVKIAGCNDCHTPGYAQTGGNIPEKQWLTGDQVGFRGPWGTTYPVNLRLYMQKLTENEWIKTGHTAQFRPPMPWFALRDMTAQDLGAIYRFTRYLGPVGEPAPAYVPPGQEPKGPYVLFPQPAK